MLEVSDSQFSI